MKRKIFIVAAIIFSSRLLAQNIQKNEEDSSGQILDEVAITANKYPKKQNETGKVITIINRAQLERSSGKTLGEILNSTAGTTIIGANNNLGTNQTASIRGSSSGNVLILVDGIPVNDPSTNNNYFDLNFFAADQIERIEILKGGQSTLYGSDAVAGVINIITKKNVEKKFVLNAGVSAGSYNTFKENIGVGGNTKKINYSLQYTHLASDGFSAAYDSTGVKNFANNSFYQHLLSSNAIFKFSSKLQAKISGSYSYYKTWLDAAAFTDEKDYTVENKNLQGGIGLTYNENNGSLHFNYFFNYVSRDYLDDSVYRSNPYVIYSKSTYIGRTHFAEFYANRNLKNWEMLAGIDFRGNSTFQQYFSTGLFGPYSPPLLNKKMSQFSAYSSLVYKRKNGFSAEAGGRWNHHSEYGNNFTYTFNPSYLINNKAKIFLNLYSAFKTPTLYQLFDPLYGNNNLKPEQGKISEAGIKIFPSKKLNIRAVGFYRLSKNVIEFIITDLNSFTSQYQNISKQKNYGVEIEVSYSIKNWTFNGNYAYTDGSTVSHYDGTGFPLGKDTTYNNLYRIPKNVLNITMGYQAIKNLFVSASFKAVGKRLEAVYGSAPAELKSYYTIDVYGEYKLKSKWKIFTDLKNITNQKYFDILGYNSKRFNFTAGVNFNL
jgi:vitamin B12 transporter